MDHLFNIALGGAVGANFHGGGDTAGYTPIADNNGAVVAARPEYYGLLLFTLAGQGKLLQTSLEAGGLNATAYTVQTTQGYSIVVVNKDGQQNLSLTIELPNTATSASMMVMTGSSLSATSGIAIQGASVAQNGSFHAGAPYTLSTNGTRLTAYAPSLSAILTHVSAAA